MLTSTALLWTSSKMSNVLAKSTLEITMGCTRRDTTTAKRLKTLQTVMGKTAQNAQFLMVSHYYALCASFGHYAPPLGIMRLLWALCASFGHYAPPLGIMVRLLWALCASFGHYGAPLLGIIFLPPKKSY
jgi:hypothetical protein